MRTIALLAGSAMALALSSSPAAAQAISEDDECSINAPTTPDGIANDLYTIACGHDAVAPGDGGSAYGD